MTTPHPRNLPQVLFIEDEETFLRTTGLSPEEAALEMRQAFEQLRLIRDSLMGRKESLLEKLPEHERTLQMVHHLAKAQEDTHMRFELTGGM
jgi:hypothetical protein